MWHLSIAVQKRNAPMQVLRWSPTQHRLVENARDQVFAMCGTAEPVIEERELVATRQFRKPLSLEEINRMAPTPEVRERRGRP